MDGIDRSDGARPAEQGRPDGRWAVLVVDVQEAAVRPGLFAGEVVLGNIVEVVARARRSDIDVVWIRHDGPPGDDYEPGTPGWCFHHAMDPRPGEHVVGKSHNSAFQDTDLAAYLRSRDIRVVVVVGLHTELCVDSTVRGAFAHGFRVVVPEMTNTTFDAGELTGKQIYRHHVEHVFRDRFAEVVPLSLLPEPFAPYNS